MRLVRGSAAGGITLGRPNVKAVDRRLPPAAASMISARLMGRYSES
jgi:hypothetical protein